MIIRYPTGFYNSVLPKDEDDTISVTYTISGQDPPRTSLVYPKLPRGLALGRLYSGLDLAAERVNLGELLYTITASSRSETQSGNKQYVIGQNLTFSTVVEQLVEPMLIPPTVELRHDQSNVDYERIGLNSVDVQKIIDATDDTLAILTASLNDKRQLRANADCQIADHQRDIINIERTIEALNTVSTYTDVSDILAKLVLKLTALQTSLSQSILAANRYAKDCDMIAANLQTVALVAQ